MVVAGAVVLALNPIGTGYLIPFPDERVSEGTRHALGSDANGIVVPSLQAARMAMVRRERGREEGECPPFMGVSEKQWRAVP